MSDKMDRREFLQKGSEAVMAATAMSAAGVTMAADEKKAEAGGQADPRRRDWLG